MPTASPDQRNAFGAAAWLGVLGACAVLHGLLFWIDTRPEPRVLWGDEVMYQNLAAMPAAEAAAALDPLWPPLYVSFLRPLAGASAAAVTLVQLALLLLAAAMLRAVAARATDVQQVGDWAAALLLLDPQVAAFAHFRWPEIVHLALFLGALCMLVMYGQRWAALIGAGVLLGLALLTKSLLLSFMPLVPAPLVREFGWRPGLPRAALVLLVAGLVTLPTALENDRRHGYFTIADSSRFNLWLGLEDGVAPLTTSQMHRRYMESGATFAERQDALAAAVADIWRERGPWAVVLGQVRKQYFRLFGKQSVLTEQLPGGFVAANMAGYVHAPPAITTVLRVWGYAIYALVLAAAGPGLIAARLRGRPWLQMLWAFLAYNVLLFLGLHAHARLRVQFMPVLDIAAALTVSWLMARPRTEVRALLAPSRLVAGMALAIVLLGLAFGGQ
jgi:hypothetical protein